MLNKRYDASKDYFALLGVHQQACEKTIKQAYRKMARRYHPDVSKIHNATEKFQEISEAYEVLTKFRDAYWRDYSRNHGSHRQTNQSQSSSKQQQGQSGHTRWRKQTPMRGKDRVITYPLTLRYAIRLLKIGYFYIPGLKVKMKFTREAFADKTFRLKGKGYQGLFGGDPGDYLVRFKLKLDSLNWTLKGNDIYGTIQVPSTLLVPGGELELESPAGQMTVQVPINYSSDEYIKVLNMGLPGDETNVPGHLYAKLIAA